jgi:hypothetical protein
MHGKARNHRNKIYGDPNASDEVDLRPFRFRHEIDFRSANRKRGAPLPSTPGHVCYAKKVHADF